MERACRVSLQRSTFPRMTATGWRGPRRGTWRRRWPPGSGWTGSWLRCASGATWSRPQPPAGCRRRPRRRWPGTSGRTGPGAKLSAKILAFVYTTCDIRRMAVWSLIISGYDPSRQNKEGGSGKGVGWGFFVEGSLPIFKKCSNGYASDITWLSHVVWIGPYLRCTRVDYELLRVALQTIFSPIVRYVRHFWSLNLNLCNWLTSC